MFRRRTQAEPEQAPQPVKPGGKGRPTPKRSEAQKLRRQPITAPPKDRKEAYRQLRSRQAAERSKARDGMREGVQKYLPRRDQGPVRRFARDFVDSRRFLLSYMMYVMIFTFALGLLRSPLFTLVSLLMLWLMMAIVVIEGLWLTRRIKRLAAERFPGESVKGLGWYAVSRAMQIRRLRMPAPQVKFGDRPEAAKG